MKYLKYAKYNVTPEVSDWIIKDSILKINK